MTEAEKALEEFRSKYPEECKEAGEIPARKLAIYARYYELMMNKLRQ